MLYTIISACVFAAVFYNWPRIQSAIGRFWRFITRQNNTVHFLPGEKRNNMDLFGDVDVSKTKPLYKD